MQSFYDQWHMDGEDDTPSVYVISGTFLEYSVQF